MTKKPIFSLVKPSAPGAYWVRGFDRSHPQQCALVEVRDDPDGLVCNLHEVNSDDDTMRWPLLDNMSPDFEWAGPLVAP